MGNSSSIWQIQTSGYGRDCKYGGADATHAVSLGIQDAAPDVVQTAEVSTVDAIPIPVRIQEHPGHRQVSDKQRRDAESRHQVYRCLHEPKEVRSDPRYGGDDVQQR